jgi:hypothetical protein
MPGAECLECDGPIPRNPQQEEAVKAGSHKVGRRPTGRSREKLCRECKRTEDDGATFYSSTPTLCKECHSAKQKSRSHPGNIHLPPAAAYPPSAVPDLDLSPVEDSMTTRLDDDLGSKNPTKGQKTPTTNQIQGPNEASKTPTLCICTQCGAEFTEYKRGCAVIRTVCQPCILRKTVKTQHGDRAPSIRSTAPHITLYFVGDEDQALLSKISAEAKLNRRAPDDQVLFILEWAFREAAK